MVLLLTQYFAGDKIENRDRWRALVSTVMNLRVP